MKSFSHHLLASLLLGCTLLGASGLVAAEAKPKTPEAASEKAEATKPKREWYPFAGIVASVDKKEKTIALKKKDGERVIRLDAKSELEVGGKTGTLAEVKVGDYVHGKLHKNAAGQEVILAAKFDKEAPHRDKPAGEKAADDKGQNKPKR